MNSELKATALLLIEENDDYYLIPRDQLERFHGTDDQKEDLKKLFGEMALLADAPRTDTVRTTMPCELYSLTRDDFVDLLEREPALREAISTTVASRREALAALNSIS